MLIKNFVGAQLPFPLFPHLLPTTAEESAGVLMLVSRSGGSPQTTFSEFWGERVLLARAILVIITLYICSPWLLTAQSAAPAGGRPVRPHHLAPPSRRHCKRWKTII